MTEKKKSLEDGKILWKKGEDFDIMGNRREAEREKSGKERHR